MTAIMAKTKSNINKHSKTLLVFALSAIALILLMYLYFLGVLISEILDKNNNIKYLHNVNFEYQAVEENYFLAIGSLNIEYAKSLGFVDGGQNRFVVRQTSVARR